jgi:hypothetical protein
MAWRHMRLVEWLFLQIANESGDIRPSLATLQLHQEDSTATYQPRMNHDNCTVLLLVLENGAQ